MMPATTMNTQSPVRHAMTVDVEDYFHVAALAKAIKPSDWGNWPSTVERNTRRLLDLFDEHQMKATFFVLGWVAEHYPELIHEIDCRGHEIASHGYSHQLIYRQTPATFREETTRSKALLEELIQKPVIGYRAASYSITQESLWALDILAELGFQWDSSIFPVHHDRYGIPNSPTSPYRLRTPSGHEITEFPLTTATVLGLRLPAAGGGYFRLYPYWLSRLLLQRASANGDPAIFYLHPWEIDPEQPRVKDVGMLSTFRHYNNLDRCYSRLRALLHDFPFTTVTDSLGAHPMTQTTPIQLAST